MSKHGSRKGVNDGEFSRYDLVCLFGCGLLICERYVLQVMDNGKVGTINGDMWGEMVACRVDEGGPSLTITNAMEELPPIRINHNNAHIPDPTEKNLEALALKAWIDYSGSMQPIVEHEMPSWDDLSDKLKDVWRAVAKGQHVCMSLIGGAEIEQIDAEQA